MRRSRRPLRNWRTPRRSSPRSMRRRTRTRAWWRSTAAWSNACMPTWRAARSDWPKRLRRRRTEDRRRTTDQEQVDAVCPRLSSVVRSRPRTCLPGLFLEAVDLRRLLHGQADIVEAVEQAVLAMRVDLELDHAAVGAADLLLREVDRQRGNRAAVDVVEQLFQVLRRYLDRQDAVLEAVVVEDVAELGRDHAADAEVEQRPGRVLAARAAAEILGVDQDPGLAIRRLVEHEVRLLAAVVAIAQLGEQDLAAAGAPDRLQVLL